MEISKEVSAYMAELARKGNGMRSTEAYREAAKKGWKQRKKKVIHKKDTDVIDSNAHGE